MQYVQTLHFIIQIIRLYIYSFRIPQQSPQILGRHTNVLPNKVLNIMIRCNSRVMQINTMSRSRSKESASPVITTVQHVQSSLGLVGWVRAVAKAEGQVVVAVHNRHRVGVVHRGLDDSGGREEFTESDGALGCFGEVEDGGVEAGSAEEADLVGDGGGGDEVAVGDVGGGEAVGGVLGGDSEVEALKESGHGG